MQTNQENTQAVNQALLRSVDVTLVAADLDKDVEARLKRMARTVKMDGFRPGKVPMKVVAQRYGYEARMEAMDAAINKAFVEAVRAQGMRIAGQPVVEPKEGAADSELAFTVKFEAYPEIVIGDISACEINRSTLEVGDADVEKTLDVLRKQRTTYEVVERAAAEGDRVVIDFVGKQDGVPFEGGTAQDFPVVVGSGSMLKEFDAQLNGASAGETRAFDLTFPEDYHAKQLAGKTVQFEITVKKVEAAKVPEVDAELAKAFGVSDGDVAKLRADVKANLEREVKFRLEARVKDQAMDALMAANPIEVPTSLVMEEAQELAESARRDMEMRGFKTKDLPISAQWFVEQAERRVKLGLLVTELVKSKELHATAEQIRARVEEMASSYEDPAEVVKYYYADTRRLTQIEAMVVEANVVDWMLANAKVTDTAVSFDELMNQQGN